MALLPIYWCADDQRVVFYAPRLVCILDERRASLVLSHIESIAAGAPAVVDSRAGLPLGSAWSTAVRLVLNARDAEREIADVSRREFAPECLTIYVSNQCNMRCRYCFSRPSSGPGETVSFKGVRAAARLVARECAERSHPFTVALHGGGEPALDPRLLERILGIATEESRRFGLRPRTYIATNGAVPEETARLLANLFDHVGVSCDGPPAIQDRQRSCSDGQPRSGDVSRTMRTLRRFGRPFDIRATITRETVDRQPEIVSHLADRYAPNEIRIEPVYANPSGDEPLHADRAAAFVRGFLEAQEAGRSRGVPVTTSITRPDSVYGPYCNVPRRVLNLVPGDIATGCFLESRPEGMTRRGVVVGSLDQTSGEFRLEGDNIRTLSARYATRYATCTDCLCSHQCTRGCPDRCVLESPAMLPDREGGSGGFRCAVNRLLLEATIRELVDRSWNATPRGDCRVMRDARSSLQVAAYRDGTTL